MTVDFKFSTNIQISWTASCPEVDKYDIAWERDTTKNCRDIELFDGTIINSNNLNIRGLEEDSHYTITVTASVAGIAVNDSVIVKTAEAGKGNLLWSEYEVVKHGVLSFSSICPPQTCQYN